MSKVQFPDASQTVIKVILQIIMSTDDISIYSKKYFVYIYYYISIKKKNYRTQIIVNPMFQLA